MTSWNKIFLPIFIVLTILFAVTTAYYHRQYEDIKANPQKVAQDATNELVKRVSELMVLPNETPNVATITDLAKLKDQPFFAKAKVGDRVLIFPNAKKVVLYDPVNHKILDVAPLNTGAPPENPAPPPSPIK